MAKIKEERREIEELRLIYNKKIQQIERDEAEEELERSTNQSKAAESTIKVGGEGIKHLQPPTPKKKVKVKKVRR